MSHLVSVRSAVFDCLDDALEPNKASGRSGEDRLKALELTEEYGTILAEITVDPNESPARRQLAAVLLKQYVDTHWSIHSEKFTPPEVTNHVKAAVRSVIPLGLTEPSSRVRSTVAYVISSIAHWDWPEDWPELFDVLMQALTSGNPHAVHGSMRVLTEFTREIIDTQMVKVAPVILPELYRIFVTTGQYSNRSRSRAITVFITCTDVIIELSQMDKNYIKELLLPVLPKFIEAFLEALQSKDLSVTDTGIKTEAMKALTVLVKHLPSHMGQHFQSIVATVWGCLVTTSEAYVRSSVATDAEDLADDPVDSDGTVIGPESLIYSLFEFIHALVDKPKFHTIIKQNVQQLLYYITVFMQITAEQEVAWSQSASQFVEDEDDDSFSYSVRVSAQDLLLAIVSEFEDEALVALAENVQAHLKQAETEKMANLPCWWKIHEAVFLTMGAIRLMLVSAVTEGKLHFNIEEFLHNVVLQDITIQDGRPLLTGRCLWMASRYTHAMQPVLINRFLEATVAGLADAQPACVRISAVRATFHFCEGLTKTPDALTPVLPILFERVMSIAQGYSSEVLALCLDAIEELLKVNQEFTGSIAEKSMPFYTAVFLKYSHDQHIIEACKNIIKTVAAARGDVVQLKMLPTLLSIIQQRQPDKLPSTLQPGALEMLESLLRGSPEPLSDELMAIFPVIANITIDTEDSSIMQNGGECLRAFISKSAQQVVDWRDDRGNTGLSIIGSVVSKLLDPKSPEYSAAYVGRLLSLLISKLGDSIGSDLDLILRAVLSKLQQTETLTIVQELILVFARLILLRVDALLDFLSLTPGPDGTPALNFVLTQWCSRQHIFFGAYETKVGAMALATLLLHAVNANDSRLQSIYLKEEVISQSSVIRTRSKSKAAEQQYTDTPILIKIYKLLINELAHQLEEAQFLTVPTNGHSQVDEEGYDDVSDEDGDHRLLSDLVDNVDLIDELEDEEDDPDVLNDPLYSVNLKDYLTDFLKSLSQSQYYETFKVHHTVPEQRVLRHIGIAAV